MSRILTFRHAPGDVIDAAVLAADAIDGEVHVDLPDSQIEIRSRGPGSARPGRLIVSITDSGVGGTTVHLYWEPAGSLWARRTARHFGRSLQRELDRPVPPADIC